MQSKLISIKKDYRDFLIKWVNKKAFSFGIAVAFIGWVILFFTCKPFRDGMPPIQGGQVADEPILMNDITPLSYSLGVFSDTIPKQPKPKSISITLPEQGWRTVLTYLEIIKNEIKQSDFPAKKSTFLCDSIIVPIQNEFILQMQKQIDTIQKPKNK